MTAAESGDMTEPAARLSGPAVARAAAAGAAGAAAAAPVAPVRDIAAAARDANAAVTELYAAHYRSLVGLAALLLPEQATAEQVVQDAFVAMHSGWRRLRDADKALGYLRRSVINGSRSALAQAAPARPALARPALGGRATAQTAPGAAQDARRPQQDALSPPPRALSPQQDALSPPPRALSPQQDALSPPPSALSPQQDALSPPGRTAMVAALGRLPLRDREALVLRFYADMSPAQIGSAMGISAAAVEGHMARALSSLRSLLEALA
jgi:RNA polymerase sigma factor (sigma-70 family)